jgi:hypothetical protein
LASTPGCSAASAARRSGWSTRIPANSSIDTRASGHGTAAAGAGRLRRPVVSLAVRRRRRLRYPVRPATWFPAPVADSEHRDAPLPQFKDHGIWESTQQDLPHIPVDHREAPRPAPNPGHRRIDRSDGLVSETGLLLLVPCEGRVQFSSGLRANLDPDPGDPALRSPHGPLPMSGSDGGSDGGPPGVAEVRPSAPASGPDPPETRQSRPTRPAIGGSSHPAAGRAVSRPAQRRSRRSHRSARLWNVISETAPTNPRPRRQPQPPTTSPPASGAQTPWVCSTRDGKGIP